MADQLGRLSSTPVAPPLVGRDRERAILRGALDAVLAGHGSLVLIGGEAGIGKSALAEEVCREAAGHGAIVLVGRSYDLAETPPYGPWLDLFAHGLDGCSPPPLLAAMAGGGTAGGTSQATLFDQMHESLAAMAARRPLVLLLDDLHWADPASLDLLRSLGRELARSPILLIAIYRTEELTRRHPLYPLLPVLVREAAATRVDLRPLDDGAIRALLRARYDLAESEEARLVTYLQARAEGNPFFAGELLRTLEEAGLLRPADGNAWTLGDLAGAGVPPLLRQVIDARADRLGAAARDLLAVAAVIGQDVPLVLWAAVGGVADEALLDVVERAVGAHLLMAAGDGTGVRFVHALTREALYEGLLPPRRRGWHRRVAEALLSTPGPDPDAMVYQLQRAGDPRVFVWLVRSGVRACRAAAQVSAAERFVAAAGLLDGDGARARARGWLLLLSGLSSSFSDIAQSVRAMDEAEALALAAGDVALAAHARFNRGRIRCMRGEYRRGLAEMERELAALDALPREHCHRPTLDVALATVESFLPEGVTPVPPPPTTTAPPTFPLVLLVNHLALAGRYHEALARSEGLAPGAHTASDGGSHQGIAPLHLGRGHALAALGCPVEARHELALARADQRASSSWFMVTYAYWFELLAVILPYRADDVAERSRLAAAGGRAWARAAGTNTTATHGAQSDLPLALLEGRWAEARRLAEAGRASTIVGFFLGAIVALGTLARHQGAPERAWAQVRTLHPAGPATEPGDSYFPHGMATLALAANLALDAGDSATARSWIAAHGRWLGWSGAILWRAEHALLSARLALLASTHGLARDHAKAALAHATEPRQPLALLAAHRRLGELDTAAGDYPAAADHLAQALVLADACAAPYERALTLLALAELRAAQGQASDVAAPLSEARAAFTDLGATPAMARADALAARLIAAPSAPVAYPTGLTAREVEVLRLLAAGKSNRAIAAALFLSPHTVERHVANVYAKTGAHGRAEATAFARRHHLA